MSITNNNLDKLPQEDIKEAKQAGQTLADAGAKGMIEVTGIGAITAISKEINTNKSLEKPPEISR